MSICAKAFVHFERPHYCPAQSSQYPRGFVQAIPPGFPEFKESLGTSRGYLSQVAIWMGVSETLCLLPLTFHIPIHQPSQCFLFPSLDLISRLWSASMIHRSRILFLWENFILCLNLISYWGIRSHPMLRVEHPRICGNGGDTCNCDPPASASSAYTTDMCPHGQRGALNCNRICGCGIIHHSNDETYYR